MLGLSPARTLFVPMPSPAPYFGASDTELVWPSKSSAGILVYGFDLGIWLADAEDGQITGIPDITIIPNGDDYDLIGRIVGITTSGVIEILFAGGIPGTIYTVEIGTTTDGGLRETFAPLLPINYASPATIGRLAEDDELSAAGIPITAAGITLSALGGAGP